MDSLDIERAKKLFGELLSKQLQRVEELKSRDDFIKREF